MGILPLQFKPNDTVSSLGLLGNEKYSFNIPADMQAGAEVEVSVVNQSGAEKKFKVISRIDTGIELQYYKDGGILCTVIKNLAST